MVNVQFQIWGATNLGTTKVFQTKSQVGGDIANPGIKPAEIVKTEVGFVNVEVLLTDTETIGPSGTLSPPSETFGWIIINGFEYFADKVSTYNTNGGKVFVAFHVSVRTLEPPTPA